MNVLIVDDDRVFRLQIEAFLYKMKYNNVEAVASYEDALAYLQTHHVDIIILDIVLSANRSGLDLARHIKARNIPILFITSQESEEFYEQASSIPLSSYLVKPFHAFSLDSHIRNLIEKCKDHTFLRLNANKGGLIKLTDIIYVEVENTYSIVHTENKKVAYKKSLTQLMQMLPMHLFLQIHRSYVVQKRYIRQVDFYENNVTLVNDLILPMSRRMKQDIKKNVEEI